MPSPEASTVASPDILILGTLPPPVTGMTVLTKRVVDELQRGGPVQLIDWSTGHTRKGIKFRIARVIRVLSSLFRLLRIGRKEGKRLYLVANSQWGLYLTWLFVLFARQLGYQIFLHHHTYSYIDRRDWRMTWIDRQMHRGGVHVVHCDRMIADFRRQYDSQCDFAIVYPSVVSLPIGQPKSQPGRPFRLGHLSNLTIEKGLDLVIETFENALKMGHDTHLVLAGPVQRGAAKRILENALTKYAGRINYRGPVYGSDKRAFFDQIDTFLFPTRNESWGIVLNEALSAGVPVITYDRGCTQIVVGTRAGLVIPKDAEFRGAATAQIQRWIEHADEYRAASQAAIAQAEYLHVQGKQTLEQFAAHMFS